MVFAGFRHPHIFSLWSRAKAHQQCQIVGSWENDPVTRDQLRAQGEIELSYDTFECLLSESNCTVVAVGDVYARRGPLIIKALEAGKHVIADKPICTTLKEFERIARLVRENNLSLGCQLDLVESGSMRRLRQVIREGIIGSVFTITIMAQHPLRYSTRAKWYFEEGQHGGNAQLYTIIEAGEGKDRVRTFDRICAVQFAGHCDGACPSMQELQICKKKQIVNKMRQGIS